MDVQTSSGMPLWMRRRLVYGFASPEELETQSAQMEKLSEMRVQDRDESDCMNRQDHCRTGCAQTYEKLVRL